MSNQTSDEYQRQRLEQDSIRLQQIRDRNEIRSHHMRNSTQRMIGLNVNGLNEQMSEKERIRIMNLARGRAELKQLKIMDHLMEENNTKSEKFRMAGMSVLGKTWQEQIKERNQRKLDSIEQNSAIDYSKCSMSACQRFEGEDENVQQKNKEKIRLQKKWLDDDIAQKKNLQKEEIYKQQQYNQYLMWAYDEREKGDKALLSLKREADRHSLLVNQKLAAESKIRSEELKAKDVELEKKELEKAYQDPILCENNEYLIKETGKIRKHNFRGFPADMRKKLYIENQMAAVRKKERDAIDKQEEAMYSAQLKKLLDLTERDDYLKYKREKDAEIACKEAQKAEMHKKEPKLDLSWGGDLRTGYTGGFGIAYY